ncbi:MAG: hypothetical protein HYX99_04620, partial [Chloroflexi bacterium]|nr:hypothetical protein [Chloroflexota bacterium]
VDPELRNRIKAEAALEGKTLRDWATEALIEKLEDAVDAREGLAALNEPGESIPWEQVKAEWEALHKDSGVPAHVPSSGTAAAS